MGTGPAERGPSGRMHWLPAGNRAAVAGVLIALTGWGLELAEPGWGQGRSRTEDPNGTWTVWRRLGHRGPCDPVQRSCPPWAPSLSGEWHRRFRSQPREGPWRGRGLALSPGHMGLERAAGTPRKWAGVGDLRDRGERGFQRVRERALRGWGPPTQPPEPHQGWRWGLGSRSFQT